MPTGLEEEWRFTPMGHLAPLLSGRLDGPVSVALPDAVPGLSNQRVTKPSPLVGVAPPPSDRAAAQAWAAANQADVVTLSGQASGELLAITVEATDTPGAHHLVVRLEAGVRAGIVLNVIGRGNLSQTVEVAVGPGAALDLVTVQELAAGSVHHGAHRATVQADGRLRHTLVSVGAGLSRTTVQAELAGQGGQLELFGLNLTGAGQHHEAQLFIDHAASQCRSRATYKGALLEAGARSVWVGDVLIRAGAHGTDTYEENRNLVLAKGTQADAVPNLEIETGQIEGAGHAATTGRFDQQQLFYLMSRGIDPTTARSMVVRAFFAELIGRIGLAPLQSRLIEIADTKLLAHTGLEGGPS